MSTLIRGALRGAAAGASGTTALNTLTYLVMVARARPASTTPEDTVEELSRRTGIDVPGAGKDRDNRVADVVPHLAYGIVTAGVLQGLESHRPR